MGQEGDDWRDMQKLYAERKAVRPFSLFSYKSLRRIAW